MDEGADKKSRTEGNSGEAPRGRPQGLGADGVKSTVTLEHGQIVWLDRLSVAIRERSRKVVDRGALIRGILRGIQESGIDLSGVMSEEEVVEGVLARILAWQGGLPPGDII